MESEPLGPSPEFTRILDGGGEQAVSDWVEATRVRVELALARDEEVRARQSAARKVAQPVMRRLFDRLH